MSTLRKRTIRSIRPLSRNGKETFTQPELFDLHRGLFDPKVERIIGLVELDDDVMGIAWDADCIDKTRSKEYGFYKKGFETHPDMRFGDKIVHVETLPDGRQLVATLKIPKGIDVKFSSLSGRIIKTDLREAYGLGLIKDISKLRLVLEENDSKVLRYTVEFESGFNPRRDLRVIDAMQPSGFWGWMDENGIPLRSKPASYEIGAGRIYYVHGNEFEEGATGWHGSFMSEVYSLTEDIYVCRNWSFETGVAVANKEPSNPLRWLWP